ncbi:phospholipase A1 member A-like [Leguminivora glycinivorella]|uniref:phospholipase A1 member A-like n=1 Tax=Leguminivora glycinivorella TaxID=1035111 RepID=UPI00200EA145|nr:phospholipase A1 member A-like [Leguminivora glycinivorella]
MMKVVQIVIISFISVNAVEYSRETEGYSEGFIPDCPGASKPAVVRPPTLKKLIISVVGKHGNITGSYNYYHMHNLAKNSDIDFSKKTFMYVGGYLDSTTWQTGRILGQVYKKHGYNVLVLETLEFTATVYPIAVRHMYPIGRHAAEMLVTLKEYGLDPKQLELVGISLGGHTMGFIAKNYRHMTGQNISTLTALDPAGPCFRNVPPDQRLDRSDADFVMGVITNMDGSGISVRIGHVMFYVNGGEYQYGHYWWLPCDVSCSHIRSYFLWWSALLHPGSFIGIRCDTVQKAKDGDCFDENPITNTMDLYTDRSNTGFYYLRTSNRWPFALGKRGLKKPGIDAYMPSSQQLDVPDLFKYIHSAAFKLYN